MASAVDPDMRHQWVYIIADGMKLFAIKKGFGSHTEFLGLDSLVQALKHMQLRVLVAALAIWIIKVSV